MMLKQMLVHELMSYLGWEVTQADLLQPCITPYMEVMLL